MFAARVKRLGHVCCGQTSLDINC